MESENGLRFHELLQVLLFFGLAAASSVWLHSYAGYPLGLTIPIAFMLAGLTAVCGANGGLRAILREEVAPRGDAWVAHGFILLLLLMPLSPSVASETWAYMTLPTIALLLTHLAGLRGFFALALKYERRPLVLWPPMPGREKDET